MAVSAPSLGRMPPHALSGLSIEASTPLVIAPGNASPSFKNATSASHVRPINGERKHTLRDLMPLEDSGTPDQVHKAAVKSAEVEGEHYTGKDEKGGDGPPWKIMLFTMNLLIGLTVSQVVEHNHIFAEIVAFMTMFCLSFIMIGVGYEFEIDKSQLGGYAKDAGVAMGAAAIPWLLGAAWFMLALPDPLPFKEALAIAIFSAPTSAGILFSMLEAAGLKETWLFQKARVLAIFDDLGTILLLIPIKALIVGPQWELSVVMALIVILLSMGWFFLHKFRIPCTWNATMTYAVLVTGFCELLHYVSNDHLPMEAIHLEVLLPAFTFGVVVFHQHFHGSSDKCGCPQGEKAEDRVGTAMSAIFMIFVGLSMPRLEIFGGEVGSGSGSDSSTSASNASDGNVTGPLDEDSSMGIGPLLGHVVGMTILMILGKFVPFFFYKTEASNRERFALCLGMCPRGEVGAGVIVVALQLGIRGDSVTIAVMCLALNLILSGFFIMGVKKLLRDKKEVVPIGEARVEEPKRQDSLEYSTLIDSTQEPDVRSGLMPAPSLHGTSVYGSPLRRPSSGLAVVPESGRVSAPPSRSGTRQTSSGINKTPRMEAMPTFKTDEIILLPSVNSNGAMDRRGGGSDGSLGELSPNLAAEPRPFSRRSPAAVPQGPPENGLLQPSLKTSKMLTPSAERPISLLGPPLVSGHGESPPPNISVAGHGESPPPIISVSGHGEGPPSPRKKKKKKASTRRKASYSAGLTPTPTGRRASAYSGLTPTAETPTVEMPPVAEWSLRGAVEDSQIS